jgi:hypothetical protein
MFFPEQAEFWLFPADSASGHLVEHKEERSVLSKWGNDLRQSYRTLAQAAGVNAGYITRDKLLRYHLRKQQERISAIVLERAGRTFDGLPLIWLSSTRVDIKSKIELKTAA